MMHGQHANVSAAMKRAQKFVCMYGQAQLTPPWAKVCNDYGMSDANMWVPQVGNVENVLYAHFSDSWEVSEHIPATDIVHDHLRRPRGVPFKESAQCSGRPTSQPASLVLS